MSNLRNTIRSLYGEVAEQEVILAESNLLGFFKTLERIEERISRENQVRAFKEKSNEQNNENFRSTN